MLDNRVRLYIFVSRKIISIFRRSVYLGYYFCKKKIELYICVCVYMGIEKFLDVI